MADVKVEETVPIEVNKTLEEKPVIEIVAAIEAEKEAKDEEPKAEIEKAKAKAEAEPMVTGEVKAAPTTDAPAEKATEEKSE